MNLQGLPAILIVGEHLIVGEVETRGRRMLEVLNDAMADWLSVRAAHISRRGTKGRVEAEHEDLLVRKADLKVIVLGGGRHEAPETRRFARVEKRRYAAWALVGDYEVKGALHLKTKRETIVLFSEFGAFVPLTEATVSHAAPGDDPLQAEVAFFNKAAVTAMQIGDVIPGGSPDASLSFPAAPGESLPQDASQSPVS